MPGATSEPMTTLDPPHVMYRGIEVHNPLYEGGITVWQYGTKEVNDDCNRIKNASVGQCASGFGFSLDAFRIQSFAL